jgi:hypothetical protein
MFKFNLGDKVKCTITGYQGIVTSRTQWLNGCIRYGVQSDKLNSDGKVKDSEGFDEQQLKLVKAGAIPSPQTAAPKPGGPRRDERSPFREPRA